MYFVFKSYLRVIYLYIYVYLNSIGRMDDFLVDGKPLNTLKVVELKEWLCNICITV